MADQRKGGIGWTGRTWNPTRGCRRCAAECENCYAEEQAARIVRMDRARGVPEGRGAYDGLVKIVKRGDREEARWTGVIRLIPNVLAQALSWRSGRAGKVFVDSMSDLFYEGLSHEEIDLVVAVMALVGAYPDFGVRGATFQALTKRPYRMADYLTAPNVAKRIAHTIRRVLPEYLKAHTDVYEQRTLPVSLRGTWPETVADELQRESRYFWPLPGVWWGTSVGSQPTADDFVPELIRAKARGGAKTIFLSCEPLIGPLRLREEWTRGRFVECPDETSDEDTDPCRGCNAAPGPECGAIRGPRVDWVIVGGESGKRHRPCDEAWIKSLIEQCTEAEVPVFLKQLGGHPNARAHELAVVEGKTYTEFPRCSR